MQAVAHRLRLQRHHFVAAAGAAERILFVVEPVEFRIVQPRLLDEFELPRERGVEREKQYPLGRQPLRLMLKSRDTAFRGGLSDGDLRY